MKKTKCAPYFWREIFRSARFLMHIKWHAGQHVLIVLQIWYEASKHSTFGTYNNKFTQSQGVNGTSLSALKVTHVLIDLENGNSELLLLTLLAIVNGKSN